MVASEESLETPLTTRHIALGARMVPFAGYSMPIQYAGLVAEHKAVREAAGLFDVCHMGEIRISGSHAASFVNRLVTNDLDRVSLGQAMYTCACRESGGIVDDLIIYKQADDDILIVCNASNRSKFWAHLQEQAKGQDGIKLKDESDDTALIALQGPRALSILEQAESALQGFSTRLRPFHFMATTLAGHQVTIARTGYTGEDGVEIFCANASAGPVWDALLAAGNDQGLQPAGLGCRDTLRLEARLSLYGNELDEETNPLEAGLAWTVKLEKADFLGKTALQSAKSEGLKKRLVGFELQGRGSARAGYALLSPDGTEVGQCTSGGPSPSLGKAIGLGYLPPQMTEIGQEFLVEARGKKLPAVVVKTPFYRRS